MIMKKLLIGTAATVMLSSTAIGQEALAPVQSGDAATAAFINTLVSAINQNTADIAAQTNGVNQDVSGKTFDVNTLQFSMEADKLGTDPTREIFASDIETSESLTSFSSINGGFSLVSIDSELGKITFNSDGSLNVATVDREIAMQTDINTDIGWFDSEDEPAVTDPGTFPARPTQADVDAGATNITWTQTGSQVTVTIPGDPLENEPAEELFFEISLNGQSLQSLEPVVLDQALCVDAAGNSDATFLDPRDYTGDGINDPYCRVSYRAQIWTGVLSNVAAQ
jgi:hypothetical protein